MTLRTSTLAALVLATAPALAATAGPQDGATHPYETDDLRVPSFRTGGSCVIRNVTIHSAVEPPRVADLLVQDGDVAAIGEVGPLAGVREIDGDGLHLAPGVVDNHSHMAIERGINEGTLSITADVDISDSVDADDVAIWRALAGGCTTARLLHGSANAIGGRHEVIKLKWGRTADELRFPGAPEGVKFALGENPKRSNFRGGARFPDTRMGVEAIFHRAFTRAREYADEWAAYDDAVAAGADPVPPRRDLRLEALAGILSGDVQVHSHCYVASEILMLMRVAEAHGFRVRTFQHVLEGYKVAAEMAAHGAGGSTFGDWWAYKWEAYDAIPQNAALMDEAGVLSSVNSDSDEMVRRLYGEAAKSVRYAGMDPVRALRLVTLNSAQQLGVGDRVGSIEVGKDADLVLLDGPPLSSLSRVLLTLVDGEVEFERRDAFGLDDDPPPVPELSEPAFPVTADLHDSEAGEVVALVGGTLHPITSPDVENGTLLLQGGRIVRMGADLPLPLGARVVDVTGKHVWPGMVAAYTGLGLIEIGSVRGTDDKDEIGGDQPDVRVTASIDAESAHIPVTRHNGVTRAQVAPQGGGPMMGQSCVVRLTGDTWEEMLDVDRDMLHVRYPRVANDAEKKEEGDAAEELRRRFRAARDHDRLQADAREHGTPPPPFDPRLEALAPFATGRKRVALHADNAQTILFALRFAEELELQPVLFGVREGWKVVDELARSGLECVVGPVLTLPSSRYDPYEAPYANAAVLARAGVPVAIMSRDTQNPRNLAFHAAMACAYGLPREEALRAITYYPARALGIEDRVGSLAPGKLGDVIVTDGDLLEIASPVDYVFVDGVQQSLETRQTRFHDRYRARLRRLQPATAPAGSSR